MDVFIEPVDIQALIKEVLSIVKPLADKSENAIEVICPADIGSFRSDQTKVKQCLLNLMSNANKFTSKGKLTLTVAREGNSRVCFRVSDTGVGMTRGTARPAVPGVQPGGCLDHQALWRHGSWARHHQALLHHAGRRRDGREHARQGLDIHHQASGSGRSPRLRWSCPRQRRRRTGARPCSWWTTMRRCAACWPRRSRRRAIASYRPATASKRWRSHASTGRRRSRSTY